MQSLSKITPIVKTVSVGILGLLFFFLAACSGAEPNPADVDRVINDYMDLRVQQPFHAHLIQKSEAELLQVSCLKNKVNCKQVLELMQSRRPDFYSKYKTLLEKE